MDQAFDQVSYWRDRHNKLRGDHRATGNISKSPEQMLQRKLIQAYFFASVVQAAAAETYGVGQQSGRQIPFKVLDIGFGTGFLGSLLTIAGFEYAGYDLSEVAVEDSAAICPGGSYSIKNIVEIPAQPSDFIIASEVLFHIVDDGQWISALKNIRAGMHQSSVFMFTETFVSAITAGPVHFKPRTRAMYIEALKNQRLRFANPGELLHNRMPVFNQYENFKNSVHFVKVAD